MSKQRIQRGTSSNLLQDDKLAIGTEFALPVGDDFTGDEIGSLKLKVNNKLSYTNNAGVVKEITTQDDIDVVNALIETKADSSDLLDMLQIAYSDPNWSVNHLIYTFDSPVTGDYAVFNNTIGRFLVTGEITQTSAGFTLANAILNGEYLFVIGKLGVLGNYATVVYVDDKINALLTPSKNMFNPNDADYLLGRSLDNTTGLTYVAATYNTTGYMPVTDGQKIWTSGVGLPLTRRVYVYYDVNKAFLSGVDNNPDLGNGFTVPVGAKYLRISFNKDITNYQVEAGTAVTPYTPYNIKFKSELIPVTPLANDSVFTDAIINESVIPYKVNFLNTGKNLFNINDSGNELGKYMENGTIYSNPTYNLTHYVPVKPSTEYAPAINNRVNYFTDQKIFISGEIISDGNFTTPANCAFVRYSVNSSWATFQIEEGSIKTAFEAFFWALSLLDGTPIKASIVPDAPNIAIVNTIRIPQNEEIDIFYENLLGNIEEYEGKVDVSITKLTAEPLPKTMARQVKQILTTVSSRASSVKVYDKNYNTAGLLNFNVQATNKALTTALNILNHGDSYTYRQGFINKILAGSGANLNFYGLRNSTQSTGLLQCEGHGGYTMTNHTTLSKNSNVFAPFMQPSGVYKYFGVTGYMKKVATATSGDAEWYNYNLIKALFSTSTGYLLAPNTNDVMYDDILSLFKVWDGSAWQTISEATLDFTYNFAKYRATWGIPTIHVYHFHDGTNTWITSSLTDIETNWPAWKTKMDMIIASYHADNPTGKMVIGIPNAPARQGANGVGYFNRANAAYFYHKKKIIETYGNREGENIFVADYHSTIDRVFGYVNTEELPFSNYTGTERELYIADETHLGPDGFNIMGLIYWGLLQLFR